MIIENTDFTDHQKHDEHKEKKGLSKDRLIKFSKWLGNASIICKPFYYLINWFLLKCKKWNFDKSPQETKSDLTSSEIFSHNLFGLIFGIMIGFIAYGLFVTVLDQSPYISTLSSAYIIMSSIYAFSSNFRCIALMTFPYLATGDVRCLILLYASDLCISELGRSVLYNFEGFTSSFDCIISKIDQSSYTAYEFNRPLFNSFMVLLERLVNDFNSMLHYIRSVLTDSHYATVHFSSAVENGNEKVEKLHKRCNSADFHFTLCSEFMNKAYLKCRLELKSYIEDVDLPEKHNPFKGCSYVKDLKYICSEIHAPNESCNNIGQFIANSSKLLNIKNITDRLERIFDVVGKENVTFIINSDELDRMTSKVDEERTDFKHLDSALKQFEEMDFLISALLFLWTLYTMMQLVVKSTIFRNRWLNNISFDNHYITPAYIQQEKQAVQQGHRPTLPLTPDESEHYKMLFDLSWSNHEKNTITNANSLHYMWILIIIVIILFIDAVNSCLLSLASLISHDFFQSKRFVESEYLNAVRLKLNDTPQYSVAFNGPFYQNVLYDIINARVELKYRLFLRKIIVCRPSVNSLHFDNMLIVLLIVLTIISQLTEVYLMRLRHIIMMWYYPQKSYHRSVWLREHININRDVRQTSSEATNETGHCLMNHLKLQQELASFDIKVRACFSYFNKHKSSKNNFNRPEFGLNLCPKCQIDLGNVCENCRTILLLKYSQIVLEEQLNNED
ncbi:unnamed protein product [Schistosoma turkestanicum]|nr:unnamed protein product [Schistosoma turkestanicum]